MTKYSIRSTNISRTSLVKRYLAFFDREFAIVLDRRNIRKNLSDGEGANGSDVALCKRDDNVISM